MNKRDSFLSSVLGPSGAKALNKATEANADLGSAIVARTIMSWLELVSRKDIFDGAIPDTNTRLLLKKSNDVFDGVVHLDKKQLIFNNASLNQVAGSVAVALDLDNKVSSEVPGAQLVALGKSLDLLVKARFLSTHQVPELPTIKKLSKSIIKESRLPRAKRLVKIELDALKTKCLVCKDNFFKAERFVGCHCFSELSSSINLLRKNGKPVLSFNPNMDEDAVLAVLGALRIGR